MYILFTLFKLAQRYCTSMEIPIGCVYKTRQTKYVRIDVIGCACDSDLCNSSVKTNVSMDQLCIFNKTSDHNFLFRSIYF